MRPRELRGSSSNTVQPVCSWFPWWDTNIFVSAYIALTSARPSFVVCRDRLSPSESLPYPASVISGNPQRMSHVHPQNKNISWEAKVTMETGCPNIKPASLVTQKVKNPPAMQEIPVQFLGREDPLEKG